jgi:NADPH:quinone reductase-like Zn-dependent oxidoreductase
VISAVGKNVTDLKVGQLVMCGEPRCFANRLNAPARRVVPLSPGDKADGREREALLVQAAAIQSVYTTCHHALINLARITKGKRVLIHSAAGGVGHAAISICKCEGAVIYATAGSEEKRQLVRDMGVEHVYDSRTTSWFSDLMRDTNNEGVDVVLNSLAGLHQRLGMQALRSSGRFCELGKMDIYDNSSLGLLAFRKNITFFAVDMDRLALDDPDLSAQVTRDVNKRMEAGDYHPLPTTVFPMGQLMKALEYMKTGKHVGKVVLSNYDEDGKEIPTLVNKDAHVFRDDITYLVVGGTGGFGSKLVHYAFIKGARHFIITTRNPKADEVAARLSYISHGTGATVRVVVADTTKEEDIRQVLDVARAADPPCKAIYHLAGVTGVKKLDEIKDGVDFDELALCKARAAWMLSEMSRDMEIEQFVMISSIAALIGGEGNATYSAANAYLDGLTRYRRAQGLPATTFNMTSITDTGLLVKNPQYRRYQSKVGFEYLTSQSAMEELELGIQADISPIVTMFFKEQVRDTGPPVIAQRWDLDL